MKVIAILFSLCMLSFLTFPVAAQEASIAENPVAAASGKPASTVADKVVIKGAKDVNPLKVLAKPQGYVGSCGGCASNPTYCCPSTARPVCESNGSCYCWADPHCQ